MTPVNLKALNEAPKQKNYDFLFESP